MEEIVGGEPPSGVDGTNVFDVCLDLPCTPAHARTARTVAAACGVLEGFSMDDLGDLRLLVDEVFTAMHQLGARRVELNIALGAGEVIVQMRSMGTLGPGHGAVDVRFVETLADVVGHDNRIDLLGARPLFEATLARA